MTGSVVFGPEKTHLTNWEKDFFRASDPWGFILFSRNIRDPEQLARLTGELRETLGRDAPILIDQEGGRVQRMGPPHWRYYLPPLTQMARARDPDRAMWLRYRLIAAELAGVGIDVNCAPVGDLNTPQTHEFLRNRTYGDVPETVISAARACANALLEGGVLPVLKHLPGHGRASVDSHKSLPVVRADPEELADTDFAVFEALNDLPMAMTAHVIYSQIDPDFPATTSARMIRLIREQIGFDGLLLSDDIGMEALSGGVAERAAAALGAGCDIVLHSSGKRAEIEAVAEVIPPLSPETTSRAARALNFRKPPTDVDISALEAEFADLLQGGGSHG